MKVGNKILGLAIGQKSILVAEVVAKGDRHAVSHCAEFVFPEGLSLSVPDKLGQAFRQFLRDKHILTRDVVIGLPAKRLVTRRKEVPPATPAVAASTLRLQAEGDFSSELDNLVMDFAGQPNLEETTTVLLIATNKVVVDECEAMASAAGLRVRAITSTTAALGRATSRLPGGDGLVLSIGPTGAELVIQNGLDPAHLRHLNVVGGTESISALAGEIRRTMASIPRNGTPMTLALWNSGSAENPQSILEERLSMPVTTPEVSSLVVTDTPHTEGYGPAVAVALAALEPAGLPVDFLHSRMAPPKAPAMSNQKKLAIAGGLIVAAVAAFVYIDLSSKKGEIDRLTATIARNVKAVKAANEQITRYEFAKKWLPKGPTNIEVLRDVTQLFPPQGNTIWATSFGNSRDIYTWEIDGKATSASYSQNLVDAMIGQSERFTNPRVTAQTYEPTTGLWAFRLQFTYNPPEAPPLAVASAPATGRGAGRGNRGTAGTAAFGRGGAVATAPAAAGAATTGGGFGRRGGRGGGGAGGAVGG